MRFSRTASFRALSMIALSLVGVVLVAGISPGASKPLTKKKALKLFYTKAKADERFALKGAPAADVACPGCVGENDLGFDPATQAELNSAATLGGLGRSAAADLCDPETTSYVRCVEVQLDLSNPARVLLNGRVTAFGESGTALAACRWGGVQESGEVLTGTDGNGADMSLVGITNVLPPGQNFTFAIECRAPSLPADAVYQDAWITAVAISPS